MFSEDLSLTATEENLLHKTIGKIFEFSNYKVTYPKAIIFQFDDCNFVTEKIGLISIGELESRLNRRNSNFDTLGNANGAVHKWQVNRRCSGRN